MPWLTITLTAAALLAWCCCGPLLLATIPALLWDKIRGREP